MNIEEAKTIVRERLRSEGLLQADCSSFWISRDNHCVDGVDFVAQLMVEVYDLARMEYQKEAKS